MDGSSSPIPKRKRGVFDVDIAAAPVVAMTGSHDTAPPQKKAKKTAVTDDDLADAVSNKDDILQPTPPSLASPDATHLVRADDPTKNPVLAAMTDPNIRAAYLQEVGSRTLYITNDPFPPNSQSTDSEARREIRVALKDRLVNRLTWKACVPAYNGNGGNISDFAGVEKAVKQHARHWFAEQNVVVPWQVVGPQERKRLGGLGLGGNHSPTLVAPVLNSMAPLNPQSAPKREGLKTKTPKIVSKNSSQHKGKTGDQSVEEESAPTPSREHPERVDEHRSHDHGSKQDKVRYKGDPKPLLIRDRIRATYNLFGKNVVEVKLDGVSHWVNSFALQNYCGAYSEQSFSTEDGVVDFGWKGIMPTIARAFFQAISPFPRNALPSHDVMQDADMSLNHEDVALVILPDDPEPREIEWDLDACAEMYRLAVVLKSPVVKDMVADKILEIYLEDCEQDGEEDDGQSMTFPVRFANSLTMEEDLPLLHLLVDVALDQSRRGHGQPYGLATHITRLLQSRSHGWGDKTYMLYNKSPAALCNEYHSRGRPCHKANDARFTTEHLITDIFLQIRQQTCKAATEDFNEEDAQDSDDDTPKHALDIYKLLFWSRENEKQVALCMLEYEGLAIKLNATWARGERAAPGDEKRVEWLAGKITALRVEHNERWPDYREDEGPASYAEKLFGGS